MKRKSSRFDRWFILIGILWFAPGQAQAAPEYGIFERILEASGSFSETVAALEKALADSPFTLHGKRDLTYSDKTQQARVYVLTSPAYLEAARDESPETISAQILRIGVYEYGEGRKVHVNMANPEAHAMVFYANHGNYAKMLTAARSIARELREVVAKVPGKPVSVQLEPIRSEKALNNFNGDGAAKIIAMFRNWSESQTLAFEDVPENFDAVVARVENSLRTSRDKGVFDSSGWRLVSKIPVGSNAVYFGITNDYTENKYIRISSEFRDAGKSPDSPYPGVDHTPSLPLEVLVINDGSRVKTLHYSQMWRTQLYFWGSGYRAFAKNSLIPSIIFTSIDTTLTSTAAP